MRYALEIHPKAENETVDAYNWYEDQYNGLGEMFLSDLESVYKKIELNPDFFSKAGKGFRQAVLKQFPYVVVYEIKRTLRVFINVLGVVKVVTSSLLFKSMKSSLIPKLSAG